ncbi:hypothetical protein [Domibacillus robiginosus]|nr:hypothetical protein [Domibacillus robiginosus]
MKIITMMWVWIANGDACTESAQSLHTSFTGNETYWNPAFKAD